VWETGVRERSGQMRFFLVEAYAMLTSKGSNVTSRISKKLRVRSKPKENKSDS
jgi:hypothetical protein